MKAKDFLESKWYKSAERPEAESEVRSQYDSWVRRVGNTGLVERAGKLWEYLTSGKVVGRDKILIVGTLLYLICPFDLVPDWIPVAGWFDDLGVAAFALSYVFNQLDRNSLDYEIVPTGPDSLGLTDEQGATGRLPLPDDGERLCQDGDSTLAGQLAVLRSFAEELKADALLALATTIEQRLDGNASKIVFVGRYSTGKSTLINALLGSNILPSHTIPTTRAITYIRFGRQLSLYCEDAAGNVVLHPDPTKLAGGADPVIVAARRMTLLVPQDSLSKDSYLVDTPGLEDPELEFSMLTLEEVPSADVVALVLDAGYPLAEKEAQFVRGLLAADRDQKLICVLNKIDKVVPDEVEHVRRDVRANLVKLGVADPTLHCLSASAACERLVDGQEPPETFREFRKTIDEFLRRGARVANRRIVERQVASLRSGLTELCDTQLRLADEDERARQQAMREMAEQREDARDLLDKHLAALDSKATRLEQSLRREFEEFRQALRAKANKVIDTTDLDELRQQDVLGSLLRTEVRAFADFQLHAVREQFDAASRDELERFCEELKRRHFALEVDRAKWVLEDNPSLLVGGALVVAYPFLGFLSFAYMAIGVVFGKKVIEDVISGFLKTLAFRQIKKALKEQVDAKLGELGRQMDEPVRECFAEMIRQAKAALRASAAEVAGPVLDATSWSEEAAGLSPDRVRAIKTQLDSYPVPRG